MFTDHCGKTWYKGNLHMHTTLSDGRMSFDAAVARYRRAGYDFVAVTDHRIESATIEAPDFLQLSGCEYDFHFTQDYHGHARQICIHMNGIGFTSSPITMADDTTPQQVVDAVHRASGIVFFNHPEWSRNVAEDIFAIENLDGIEIFNAVTQHAHNETGYAGPTVDQLAQGGRLLPVYGTDDAHHYDVDACDTFVYVQADCLTRDAILAALRAGRFIASRGPWVQVKQQGRNLHVACTPSVSIRVLTNHVGAMGTTGKGLKEATFELPKDAAYYRVEVTDEDGCGAWTSPVAVV